jgi:hypothetical protein
MVGAVPTVPTQRKVPPNGRQLGSNPRASQRTGVRFVYLPLAECTARGARTALEALGVLTGPSFNSTALLVCVGVDTGGSALPTHRSRQMGTGKCVIGSGAKPAGLQWPRARARGRAAEPVRV